MSATGHARRSSGLRPGERPILQVALDFVDLPRAIAGGARGGRRRRRLDRGRHAADQERGLHAVRELKAAFPDHTIVADMKTMDAGRTEVEYAAKAGASIVGVLGAASDATIKECVEAARNYGCEIIVDMIEVADPVARARRAEELGADYIGIHTAIDEQMRGGRPSRRCAPWPRRSSSLSRRPAASTARRRPRRSTPAPPSSSSAAPSSSRPTRRPRRPRSGAPWTSVVCIETTLYKRADEADIREALEQVSTANISDAWHRQPSLPGIRPLMPGAHMCGPAVTVRTYPGDWAKPVEAIDVASPATCSSSTPATATRRCGASSPRTAPSSRAWPASWCGAPSATRPRSPAWTSLPSAASSCQRRRAQGLRRDQRPHHIAGQDGPARRLGGGRRRRRHVLPKAQAVEFANRAMDVLEKENRLRGEIDGGKTLARSPTCRNGRSASRLGCRLRQRHTKEASGGKRGVRPAGRRSGAAKPSTSVRGRPPGAVGLGAAGPRLSASTLRTDDDERQDPGRERARIVEEATRRRKASLVRSGRAGRRPRGAAPPVRSLSRVRPPSSVPAAEPPLAVAQASAGTSTAPARAALPAGRRGDFIGPGVAGL